MREVKVWQLRLIWIAGVIALPLAIGSGSLQAQQVGDLYKKCKFWALSGYPTKLEFNKPNYAAFQCNEVFRVYRMSGKVNCKLSSEGLAGFVTPFDAYAFNAPTSDALVELFLDYVEANPRDWDKTYIQCFGNSWAHSKCVQ